MIHILSIKGDGMNNIFTEERDLMFRRRFSYEQFKSAEYIYRLIESKNIIPNQNFFEVLEFLLDDLRPLMKEIIETVKSSPKSLGRKNALKVLARTQEWDKSDAVRCFDDILYELPEITGIFRTCLMRRLSDLMKEIPYDLQNFMRARRHLKKLFLLNDTMLNVFEFIYIVNNARDTGAYLERDIEIWKNQNRNVTAEMLGMKTSELNEALRNLLSYGLIEDCRVRYEVDSDILPVWETPDVHDMSRLFCSPLKGKILPLDMFSISEGDLNYVKKLLTSKMKAPINIMLYGPPGTGKTTFVRSLAKALGMKAFTVNAQDKGSRRAALDLAALRRFSYKVPFTWAKPSQILALYDSLLSPLCDSEIDTETEKELLSLKRLTPGDFHSVRVQFSSFFSDDRTATHKQILSALKREESLKARYVERDIGF